MNRQNPVVIWVDINDVKKQKFLDAVCAKATVFCFSVVNLAFISQVPLHVYVTLSVNLRQSRDSLLGKC